MIGKSEWFKMRKFGGWGVTPKTWQGWVYIVAIILPMLIFQALPFWDEKTRIVVTIIWLSIIIIDLITIMLTLKKDERETKHDIISDRNALWFILIVLLAALLYDIVNAGMSQEFIIPNPFVIAALLGGAIIKTITIIYLDKKN